MGECCWIYWRYLMVPPWRFQLPETSCCTMKCYDVGQRLQARCSYFVHRYINYSNHTLPQMVMADHPHAEEECSHLDQVLWQIPRVGCGFLLLFMLNNLQESDPHGTRWELSLCWHLDLCSRGMKTPFSSRQQASWSTRMVCCCNVRCSINPPPLFTKLLQSLVSLCSFCTWNGAMSLSSVRNHC